jgi:hypothetical protein
MARSALPAALGSLYPLWGGVLAGHQEAGLRGALVGGGASMGAFVAGAMVLAALSAPISLPVVMALGAASAVAGKFAARFTFKDYRVNRFKEQYKAQIFEQIDEQLRMQRTDYLILQHVSTAYDAVKDRLIGELDTLIEQTRSTLDQLRSQKARQETLVEQQRKDSEAMLQEVNDIRSRAQGLSSQLIEIASI